MVCQEELTAMMITTAWFYVNLMMSGKTISTVCDLLYLFYFIGMVWPLEGMPFAVRQFANFLPQTMAIKSLRSVMARGLEISSPQVYIGFLSTTAWLVIFNILAVVLFRFKKFRHI